jgi:hypothetical protein
MLFPFLTGRHRVRVYDAAGREPGAAMSLLTLRLASDMPFFRTGDGQGFDGVSCRFCSRKRQYGAK